MIGNPGEALRRLLPAGSNLKRVFIGAMLEHIDGGWRLGEFGSRVGVFFCTRGTERRMVSIAPTAPTYPLMNVSNSSLTWSLSVVHMPCGAPLYTFNVAPFTIFDDSSAEAWIGTI